MLTIKQLKKDIQFNHEVSSLIDVLKGIASAQFRHMQARRERFLRFSRVLTDFFKMVDLLKADHAFLKENSSLPAAIIGISSDEGFIGDLNKQIFNRILELCSLTDEIIILGERGKHFLEELGRSFLYFPGVNEDIDYAQAEDLRDYLVSQYLQKRRWSKVLIVYPEFISFAAQEVNLRQLLPYKREMNNSLLDVATFNPLADILVEPSEEGIIDYLIRVWLSEEIHNIFWNSKLSEWAARVIHLESSSQELKRKSAQLAFSYFRALHEVSDKNIREIFASRLIR
jgi:ATP synthase F1 gamma subunit